MRVSLRINKENLFLIKKGTKNKEWRNPSIYNKRLLFKEREDGKRIGNEDIKEIEFINGYQKDAERIIVECLGIRLVKFQHNVTETENNFIALEGQFSIEIKLGKIIS